MATLTTITGMSEVPSRRRWFQFGIGSVLLLTTVLALICWQAVRWPVPILVPKNAPKFVRNGGRTTLETELEWGARPPMPYEAVSRPTIGSGLTIAGWYSARAAICGLRRN